MSSTPSAGLRRNRNWRYLWLGQAVSLIGDSVFNVTVMLWVATVIAKDKPWAPTAVSGVLIADSVPILVVGPLAGVWIDRWNRRKTMMTVDACRAVLIASLLVVPTLGTYIPAGATLAGIYCTVALESSFAQFFNPSRLAMLGQIVHPSDRGRTSGMLQATSSTASIIGPPVAAQLLFASGIEWALIVNAVSFVLSFFAIRAIRPSDVQSETPPRKSSFGGEFVAGLRFFASSKVILGLCLGVIIATLGTGALNTLQVFFVRDDLRTAATWLGTLYAAAGAGAVVGALVGGWIAGRIGAARTFCLALILGGVALLVYSRLSSISAAIAIVGCVGLTFGALNAAAPPLFLANIPQHMIGRVMSVFNPLQQAANIISAALAGLAAASLLRGARITIAGATFGPISIIFATSAVLICSAGLVLVRLLRNADGDSRQDEAVSAEPQSAVN